MKFEEIIKTALICIAVSVCFVSFIKCSAETIKNESAERIEKLRLSNELEIERTRALAR